MSRSPVIEVLTGEDEKKAHNFFNNGPRPKTEANHQPNLGFFAKMRKHYHQYKQMIYDENQADLKMKTIKVAACLLYIISPIDLIPDFILGLGQVDDLIVLGYGAKLVWELFQEYREYTKRLG